MKKLILSAFVFLFGFQAKAEFFGCHFTEPFLSVYTSSQYQLVTFDDSYVVEGSAGRTFKSDEVVFHRISKTKRQIRFGYSDKYTYLKLDIDLSKEGSDGMSDHIFPAEGVLTVVVDGKPANEIPLYGGCDVNEKRSREEVEQ